MDTKIHSNLKMSNLMILKAENKQ